jgi:hypothetical protein
MKYNFQNTNFDVTAAVIVQTVPFRVLTPCNRAGKGDTYVSEEVPASLSRVETCLTVSQHRIPKSILSEL